MSQKVIDISKSLSVKKAIKKPRIGLIGFGKTGKAVASVLLSDPSVELAWILRQSSEFKDRPIAELLGVNTDSKCAIKSLTDMSVTDLLSQYPVDAIVDFSSSQGVYSYGEAAAKKQISIVTAVSHYSDDANRYLDELAKSTRVIHSPNITVGINYLLIAAKILKKIAPNTDIEIIEEHFKSKPEISGTANVIAQHLDIDGAAIKSIRAGGIIGTHEILFGFPYQNVRLKHESISREAFGNGIQFVLSNLPQKKTGRFTVEDLMMPYFRQESIETMPEERARKSWWKFW